MTKSHPANDWKFVDEIEENYVDWFNDLYGEFSLRSEWFYGDCLEGDEKTRQKIMEKWIHSAFCAGWERAQYAMLEEQSKSIGGTE